MKIGDEVFYILEQGLTTRYIPAVITNITPKRVCIRDLPGRTEFPVHFRTVSHKRIIAELPNGIDIKFNDEKGALSTRRQDQRTTPRNIPECRFE